MEHSNNSCEEKLLIFLHIPKSGGTTLISILESQYGEENIYRIDYSEKKLQELEIVKNRLDKQAELKCITGHHPYGLHDYTSKQYSYTTMLRDPIERVISLYYFICTDPTNPMHKKYKDRGLKYFLEEEEQAKNHQTKIISGGEYDLDMAMKNIREKFSVVGITENFNESLFLMKKKFGWDDSIIHYKKENVTKKRPQKELIEENLIDLIAANNSLDIQLYQYAKELLNNKIQSLGNETRKELNNFLKKRNSTPAH